MSRARRLGKGEPAARVLEALRSLGTADGVRAVGIRTAELCKLAQVDAQNLARITKPMVDSGQVMVCRVNTPGRGGPSNEYRLGPGVPDSFRPLNTKRAGIAHGAPTKPLPVTTPAPKLSTPRPGVMEIQVPVLGQPQPAVGKNSGSRQIGASSTLPPSEAPAVAAKATPGPFAGARLKEESTARKVPAGDVDRLLMMIDQDGCLWIGDADDVARHIFTPEQTLALGDFMHGTQGVWRP